MTICKFFDTIWDVIYKDILYEDMGANYENFQISTFDINISAYFNQMYFEFF